MIRADWCIKKTRHAIRRLQIVKEQRDALHNASLLSFGRALHYMLWHQILLQVQK